MTFIKRAIAALFVAIACPAIATAQQAPAVPVQDPPIAQVLDTVQTLKRLSELMDGEGPVHEWMFMISYSAAGEPTAVIPFLNDRPVREAHRAVARLLMAGARRLPAADAPRTLAVTAVPGAKAVLRVPLETQPEILDKRAVERALSRLARTLRADRALRGTQTVVSIRMRVGTDGTVSDAWVPVPTARPAVDQAAVRGAATMRFRPAALEGRPVAVFVEVPLTFAIP